MRISDWSSYVCSSDLAQADAEGDANASAIAPANAVHMHTPSQVPLPSPSPSQIKNLNPSGEGKRDAYSPPRHGLTSQRTGRIRSEERSVGNKCGRTCSYRGSP